MRQKRVNRLGIFNFLKCLNSHLSRHSRQISTSNIEERVCLDHVPVGTQFIVQRPIPRFVVFLASTVLHAGIFMGTYELLGVRRFGFPYGGVLSQGAVNGLVGVVAFQAIELLPGAVERRAANRGRVKRRIE